VSDDVSDHTVSDELCLLAYRLALQHGAFVEDDVATALGISSAEVKHVREVLLGLRLLAIQRATGTLVPVSPEIAESELSRLHEDVIRVRRRLLDDIHHQLSHFVPLYRRHLLAQVGETPIRGVEDRASALRELHVAARACTGEVMTMQSGGIRGGYPLDAMLPQALGMLERGVTVRIICQHPARADLATQTYVRRISRIGGMVRTAAEIVDSLVIFDHRVAFVSHEGGTGWAAGATIVNERNLVAFLCRAYESSWAAADPFDPDQLDYPKVARAMQASIIRLMALGMKDAVVARRLGMATRTCRRYISSIMDELGAVSRFQAGVKAVRAGLLPEDLS
jgi:DNA-binding CsgD family transcriptional regulator